MGVSYREEMARRKKKARKPARFSRATSWQAPATGPEVWEKYARVARYRHRKAGASNHSTQEKMI